MLGRHRLEGTLDLTKAARMRPPHCVERIQRAMPSNRSAGVIKGAVHGRRPHLYGAEESDGERVLVQGEWKNGWNAGKDDQFCACGS